MLLVNFSKVSKDYGGNAVFDEVDLEVLEGQRIGLVGENGAGKSTLFRLIAGLDTPVEGTVTKRRNLTVGYLHQEADPLQGHRSVYETVAGLSPEMLELATNMHRLEARMADPEEAEMERVLHAYGEVQGRFEALGGYTAEHRVEDVLGGLGFTPGQYGQPVGTLSGGEKKLVNLARLLLEMPDLLLLDEPDNHLDLDAKGWLEGFIASYPGTVMIISHDRYLLDQRSEAYFELEDGQDRRLRRELYLLCGGAAEAANTAPRDVHLAAGRAQAYGGAVAPATGLGQAERQVRASHEEHGEARREGARGCIRAARHAKGEDKAQLRLRA